MNEELIRSLLFKGVKERISSKTITSMYEIGFIPKIINKNIARVWSNTLVGAFMRKYPRYYGEMKRIQDILGKMPQVSDLTERNLKEIVSAFESNYNLAPNTARLCCTHLKCTLSDLTKSEDFHDKIPCKRWREILSSIKGCPTTKTFLTREDIEKLVHYQPESRVERICHARFMVALFTGARISDVATLKSSNINNDMLVYVPKKTRHSSQKVVTNQIGDIVKHFIKILEESDRKYDNLNPVIREICRKCGIDEEVTYFWGGKYVTKPKWEAMRSHLGRVSFVTNMIEMGMPIHQVSKMAGHSGIEMTERYNASTDIKLTKEADDFLNMKF